MERNENYLEEAVLMMLQKNKGNDFYDTESIISYIKEQRKLNETLPIKCWRENKNIPLPSYAVNGDACCDLYAQAIEYDLEKDRYIVHTGLHVALPEDYELVIRPRSSNSKTEFYIANSPGTIDQPYRGEIMVVFKSRTDITLLNIIDNIKTGFSRLDDEYQLRDTYIDIEKSINIDRELIVKNNNFPYKVGDRIAQCIIYKRPKIKWEEVEKLEDLGTTERGDGGFGHTGK